jgi:hypothetical protein
MASLAASEHPMCPECPSNQDRILSGTAESGCMRRTQKHRIGTGMTRRRSLPRYHGCRRRPQEWIAAASPTSSFSFAVVFRSLLLLSRLGRGVLEVPEGGVHLLAGDLAAQAVI